MCVENGLKEWTMRKVMGKGAKAKGTACKKFFENYLHIDIKNLPSQYIPARLACNVILKYIFEKNIVEKPQPLKSFRAPIPSLSQPLSLSVPFYKREAP